MKNYNFNNIKKLFGFQMEETPINNYNLYEAQLLEYLTLQINVLCYTTLDKYFCPKKLKYGDYIYFSSPIFDIRSNHCSDNIERWFYSDFANVLISIPVATYGNNIPNNFNDMGIYDSMYETKWLYGKFIIYKIINWQGITFRFLIINDTLPNQNEIEVETCGISKGIDIYASETITEDKSKCPLCLEKVIVDDSVKCQICNSIYHRECGMRYKECANIGCVGILM